MKSMSPQIRIQIRKYAEKDASALASIYYNTIHIINAKDYSKEQLDAWAPITSLNTKGWKKKWSKLNPFVATAEDNIVGFAEFEQNGHIDCFYCHHTWLGKGVGSALMHAIENEAKDKGINKIFAEVSITAKPFFETKGFKTIKEQTIVRKDVELTNFVMEKII
jgi:putative acetyltransferase